MNNQNTLITSLILIGIFSYIYYTGFYFAELQKEMKPLSFIYIVKILLGITTAVLSVMFNILLSADIFTAVALGILVYWLSDRILKQVFGGKVEKSSVITKTGIGIYIISWIFFCLLCILVLILHINSACNPFVGRVYLKSCKEG